MTNSTCKKEKNLFQNNDNEIGLLSSDCCHGYMFPKALHVTGLDLHCERDTVTVLNNEVYTCRKGTDTVRVYGVDTVDRRNRTAAFRLLRQHIIAAVQKSSSSSSTVAAAAASTPTSARTIEYLEECSGRLYVSVKGARLRAPDIDEASLPRQHYSSNAFCHVDLTAIDGNPRPLATVCSSFVLDDLVASYRDAFKLKKQFPAVEYVDADGVRREMLDRRDGLIRFEFKAHLGQPKYPDLYTIALMRGLAQDHIGVVGDKDGRLLYLGEDGSLHLYVAPTSNSGVNATAAGDRQLPQEVYDFGRMTIVGGVSRMCLDEVRGLVYVWNESGYLKVYLVK